MHCNRQNGSSGTTMTGAKQFFQNVMATLRDTLTEEDVLKLTDRNRGIYNSRRC